MSNYPKIVLRLGIAKGIGLLFGLLGFFLLPVMFNDYDPHTRWAILLWYPTFGAFIGMSGVFDKHPLFGFRITWWMRAPLIGAWLNLVITLFIFPELQKLMQQFYDQYGFFLSPYWLVAEGAIVGTIIGYFATKFGGEGAETLTQQD